MNGSSGCGIRLLGAPEITGSDGVPVRLGGKPTALLAYLVLEHDRRHSRASLAAMFWPDRGDAARDNLRLALHGLRKALGPDLPWVESDRTHLRCRPERGELSVDVLDLLAGSLPPGRVAAPADIVPAGLPEVAAWWAGWDARIRTAGTTLLHGAALEALSAGRPLETLMLGQSLLDLDELSEVAVEVMARAHLALGQSAEARGLVERLEQRTAEVLGVRVGEHLRALVDQPTEPARDEDPPGRVTTLPTVPLPTPLTDFTGRTAEIATLQQAIRERRSRLLVLVGPGGVGKTRLALETARSVATWFDEGAVFARLDGLHRAVEIPGAIATVLGLPSIAAAADPLEELCLRLGEREVLIVADNVEELVDDGAADVLVELLQRCPWTVVLATSRQPLGTPAEELVLLDGLAHPERVTDDMADYDAVRLLLDRLQRVDRTVGLDEETARPIQRICQLVGGLPLGLELAASAARTLSLTEVTALMEASPAELPAHLIGAPERHHDIKALWEHTTSALHPDELAVLVRLAVFRGGFTPEHAAGIAHASGEVLRRLCDASLLQRDQQGRYRMHELIRQIAAVELDRRVDADAVRRAHRHRFLADVADAADALDRAGAAKVTERLEMDRANILAAWERAAAAGEEPLLREASGGLVGWAATTGGVDQAIRLMERAQPLAEHPRDRALWQLRIATVANMGGLPLDELDARVAEARALVEDDDDAVGLRARLDFLLGVALVEQDSRLEESRTLLRRALETDTGDDDVAFKAFVKLRLGFQALDTGDFDTAVELMRQSVDDFQSVGHLRGAAMGAHGLAHLHNERHDLWQAHQSIDHAASLFDELGSPVWITHAAHLRAEILVRLGCTAQAIDLLEEVIAAFRSHGLDDHISEALVPRAVLLHRAGSTDRAETTFAAAVSGLRNGGDGNVIRYLLFAWARFLLDRERWLQADLVGMDLVELNQRMDNGVLVAAADAIRARAALGEGDRAEARDHLERAWPVVVDRVETLFEPLETLLDCHLAWTALDEPDRARAALDLARRRLRTTARQITDPTVRSAFLSSPAAVLVRQLG